jgi:hypothetical protein
VGDGFTQLTLNDDNSACGITVHHHLECTVDILEPHWNPRKRLRDYTAIALTNHGYVCGIHSNTGFKCHLDHHVVPAYEGQLVALDVSDQGVCALTHQGRLACYFLATSRWVHYDSPAELKQVSMHGNTICVVDVNHVAYCLWSWDPKATRALQWEVVPFLFRSIAVHDAQFCGTKPDNEIRCYVFGKGGGWFAPAGKLTQLDVTAKGTVCGVAADHTVWCRPGLPSTLVPIERVRK